MPDSKSIAIQDVVAAAAEGALRALDARRFGADKLIQSGFTVKIDIICGGRLLDLIALNPQPLPPGPAPGR
jgi:hypothetical protein